MPCVIRTLDRLERIITMKKAILIFLTVLLMIALVGCSNPDNDAASQDTDVLYQVSLLQGLTLGDYHGSITVEELKKHGDIGIGTFNGLNGELVMVDGEVYRVAGDGSVEVVPDGETIPFSNVTFIDADETKELKDIPDYEALCNELNKLVEEKGKNRFYVIRIDGKFAQANVRSVNAQDEPYEPLADVLEYDQTFFDYEDIDGTIVGVYCPPYMSDLNAVGWHLHFISKDRDKGGHVLGINIADAVLSFDETAGFQMQVPQNDMFDGFDLTIDQTEDIKKVETNN